MDPEKQEGDEGRNEDEADLIPRVIEMIESGKYTEGILLTMAMLAVAEEIHLWRKSLVVTSRKTQ